MAKAGVKVEGTDELIRQLRRLTDETSGRALRTATRAGARPVQEEAKRLVPKRTGRLEKAIRTRAKVIDRYRVEVSIGFDKKRAFYGGMVELGHRLVKGRKKKEKRVIGHVAPRPYLRPALDGKAKEAEAKMRTTLRRALKRLEKRGAR